MPTFTAMRQILTTVKDIFFWRYGRTTWQYDVLCVLILAFIFLTPKAWFKSGELQYWRRHQIDLPVTRVVLSQEALSSQADTAELQKRVRELAGRETFEIKEIRPRHDLNGRVVAYEVDIQ